MAAFTPEQQQWIDDRISKVQRRLAIGFAILCVGGIIGGYELNGVINKVESKTHTELKNRAGNVHIWCSEGINQDRLALQLNNLIAPPLLPCADLENKTLHSGQAK